MKYLGLDWGLKKIGLAVSEGSLAAPLTVLKINSLEDGIQQVVQVVKKNSFDMVVIGMPEGTSGKNVKRAITGLKKAGIKVKIADETLSSKQALHEMIEQGKSKKARKEDDAMAAAIILHNYLIQLDYE